MTRPPKDIPVLLKPDLVPPTLDRTKTVTRRTDLDKWGKAQPGDRIWFREPWRVGGMRDGLVTVEYRASPGMRSPWLQAPADQWERLYDQSMEEIRRAAEKGIGSCEPSPIDDGYVWEPGDSPCRWRPSIHMFKWACRCWAVIEDIREEPLQDITEEDAKAEGVSIPFTVELDGDYRGAFAAKWDSINGHKPGLSWDDNPTVARIQFRRIQ